MPWSQRHADPLRMIKVFTVSSLIQTLTLKGTYRIVCRHQRCSGESPRQTRHEPRGGIPCHNTTLCNAAYPMGPSLGTMYTGFNFSQVLHPRPDESVITVLSRRISLTWRQHCPVGNFGFHRQPIKSRTVSIPHLLAEFRQKMTKASRAS